LKVLLRRVGDVSTEALVRAKEAIIRETGLPVLIDYHKLQPNLEAYNWKRRQYLASELLKTLGRVDGFLTLYLIDADGYEEGLNFVFGVALPALGVGGVFLARLRNEFYGWLPDEEKFLKRVEKEVLHELGHLLGLPHCPNPRCVMSFSNSILEVDEKEAAFCEVCKKRLMSRLAGSGGY